MNYRSSIIISLICLLACSQIDAPREDRATGATPASTNRNSSSPDTGSVAPSTRQKYNKTYNLFKVHHRNVFELVNENKFALRNEGQKSVEAAQDMLSMLSEADQSRLEETVGNYQQAWEGFDQRTPSVGERNRLRRAGKKIRREFNPENVRLKSTDVTKSSEPEEKRDGSPEQTLDQSTSRQEITVQNPSRYRELFNRWQRAHKKFQQGLENSDPLMTSTYDSLRSILQNMISQVDAGKDKLKNYYLSQYSLIFSKREQFSGTPSMSDHLSYLKQQFVQDFAPSSK